MTSNRPANSVFVSLPLVLLLAATAQGQFKETYQPPGYILQWGSEGSGAGQFFAPRSVTVGALGDVYVADTLNCRIQKFDSAGNFLTKWGSFGSGAGQFADPYGVASDSSGNVYVADTNNDRIQKFDNAGNYLTSWGSSGSSDAQFNHPRGVASDSSGNVYVADTNNDRIQKFDSAGNYLTGWGSSGTAPGQFDSPNGVAADASGNVYVTDSHNHRIQKFDSTGNYLTGWGSSGTAPGQFKNPFGVAADASGNTYVAEGSNYRIQKFDGAGNFLAKWGSSGSGDGQFAYPYGVAADASGDVYVAGTIHERIQKFAPVFWFDMDGYDSYLSVATLHETTAVRTLLQLENNGAPRFAFRNTMSDIEWSFQQSGPGNFLISKEGTGGPELQVYGTGMVRMGPGGVNNFTLYPNGNLTIAGSLTANGGTFPDYVFEPDYPLMPLSDLRTFIQHQKRLPNIPSAEEVKKQGGHDMTDLQLKLLEKIEELTLYKLGQAERLVELESQLSEIRTMALDR